MNQHEQSFSSFDLISSFEQNTSIQDPSLAGSSYKESGIKICLQFDLISFLVNWISKHNMHPAIDILEHRKDWNCLIKKECLITYNPLYFVPSNAPDIDFSDLNSWLYFLSQYVESEGDVDTRRQLIEIALYALLDPVCYDGSIEFEVFSLTTPRDVYRECDLNIISRNIVQIKNKFSVVTNRVVYSSV